MINAAAKDASREIRIEKRFRRSMKQELEERKRLGLVDFLLITAVAVALTEMTIWPSERYLIRIIAWGAVVFGAYMLVALGFAQLRAKGKPLDHTLKLMDDEVVIIDHLLNQTSYHPWQDFNRVQITETHFEFKRRGAKLGESYVLARKNLSSAQDRWMGEVMVEL